VTNAAIGIRICTWVAVAFFGAALIGAALIGAALIGAALIGAALIGTVARLVITIHQVLGSLLTGHIVKPPII
jgi:hypothetical protein